MAIGAQQQQTFTLLLRAQDDATAAIQSVGKELQRLGEGTSLAGLSAQLAQLSERLEAVGPRAAEAAGAVEKVGHAAEHASGPLERFAEFGKQMVVWNLGYTAFNKVTEAIGNFAGGLVSVNANLEEYQQTFTAIYQSAGKGQAAVDWLTDFAAKVPATREQVIQAGMAIASLGDNIGEVMPALSNVSAVMGVDLPRAAQAFADAQMGRFEMLQMTLHVTKDELVKYGLQLDASGHVLNNSFVPAFEKLGQVRFAAGAALQMETFTGKMSNVADALTKLQEIAGKGVFGVLKGELDGLIRMLGSTDAQRWAMGIGDALGHMLQGAMSAARWMVDNFGPPVMAAINLVAVAWQKAAPIIAGAVRLIEGVLAGIGTFLQSSVLPVVQNATGQIVQWWNDHIKDMGKVWDDVQGAAQRFWGWLGGAAHNAMTELQGAWTIAWGVISGVVGVVIDVISGDWKKGKDDLLNIWKAIEVGVLEIVNGIIDQVIHAFHMLAGPIATTLNAVFVPAFKGVVALAVELFTAMSLKIEDIFGGMAESVAQKILSIPNKIGHFSAKIGEQIRRTLGLHAGAGGGGASGFGAGPTRDEQIWAQAQAAGQSAATTVGNLLGPKQQPIQPFSFDEHQVTSVVDQWFADMEKKIDPKLTTGATEAGKKWWDAFVAALKKQGITLPTLGPGGAVPPPPGGTGYGGGAGADAADARKAAQEAYRKAQELFELFLARGAPGGYSAGMRDVAQIAVSARAAGQSDAAVQLEVLRDTNQLIDKLLENARKHFDFDASVAHPSIKKLNQDEAQSLAIMAKTPGIRPEDLLAFKQGLDARITAVLQGTLGTDQQILQDMATLHYSHAALVKQVDQVMKDYAQTGVKPGSLHYRALHQQLLDQISGGSAASQMPPIPAPAYGTYGGLATGYGQTTVSFGGTQQQGWAAVVAELRAQLAFWRTMALREQDQLRAQQATAESSQQTAINTARLESVMSHWMPPPHPAAAAGAHSAAAATRAAGHFQVFGRP